MRTVSGLDIGREDEVHVAYVPHTFVPTRPTTAPCTPACPIRPRLSRRMAFSLLKRSSDNSLAPNLHQIFREFMWCERPLAHSKPTYATSEYYGHGLGSDSEVTLQRKTAKDLYRCRHNHDPSSPCAVNSWFTFKGSSTRSDSSARSNHSSSRVSFVPLSASQLTGRA